MSEPFVFGDILRRTAGTRSFGRGRWTERFMYLGPRLTVKLTDGDWDHKRVGDTRNISADGWSKVSG